MVLRTDPHPELWAPIGVDGDDAIPVGLGKGLGRVTQGSAGRATLG